MTFTPGVFWAPRRYGMRFIAKVLKDTLNEKFPDATEDELLKVSSLSPSQPITSSPTRRPRRVVGATSFALIPSVVML